MLNGRKIERTPIREVKVDLSADRKYFILRDITTWIFPVSYFAAICQAKGGAEAKAFTGVAQKVGERDDRSNRKGD